MTPLYIISLFKGEDLLDIRSGNGQHVMDVSVAKYPMADRMEMISLMGKSRFFNRWVKNGQDWVAVKYVSFPE